MPLSFVLATARLLSSGNSNSLQETQRLLEASHELQALHVVSPRILEVFSSWGGGGVQGSGWVLPPFSVPCPASSLLVEGDVFVTLTTFQEGNRGSEWGRCLLTETHAGEPTAPAQPLLTGRSVQLSGLALFAETVWVTADQYRVYPLMGVSGKDDVFAGAWIAIFCGFSFFVVASFGVGAALCRRCSMILTVRPWEEGMGMAGHRGHPHSHNTNCTEATSVPSPWHCTGASWQSRHLLCP